MAQLLYRIGSFAVRRAWLVIGGWFVVLGLTAGAFLAFGGAFESSFSIPGTETDRVTTQLQEATSESGGATGIVTFRTTDGEPFTATQEADIAWLLERIERIEGVGGTVDPFVTDAERAGQAQELADGESQFAQGTLDLIEAQEKVDEGQAKLDDSVRIAKLTLTYPFLKSNFEATQAELDAGQAQIDAGRAELEASAPQLQNGRALFEAASGIRTVSESGSAAIGFVSFESGGLAIPQDTKKEVANELNTTEIDGVEIGYSAVIGQDVSGLMGAGELIGVAIAALVLILMLRALLPALVPLVNSLVGVAVGVLGAMAFSGSVSMASVTPMLGVMVGLAVGIDYALFILNRHRKQVLAGTSVEESIPLANGTAGNAVVFAGSTVIVALLALKVTGIPFLSVMGFVAAGCVLVAVLVSTTMTPAMLAVLGPRVLGRRARKTIGHERHTPKPARAMKTRRAVVSVIGGTVLLGIIALPALSMRLGLPDGSSEAPESPQYLAYRIIADDFGAGVNGPLLVVATLPQETSEDDVAAAQVKVVNELMAHEDVVAVAPISVLADGQILTFQVIPAEGPSSESTEALVEELRSLSPLPDGTELGIAGQASGNIDISAKLADALPLYLLVVVGLSMLILVLVFRSLLVPVVATAGFVLSLFAAFGAMTAVYQWGWGADVFGVNEPGPLLSFAPILIMGVLFGLAMDYQLFLVSGMREAYVHGTPSREAVVSGLRAGRAVVTAAAIIMVSVFGGFVFSELGMIRPLGFGLAIGVLFDAFVVRMLIVPSAMHLLGDAAWWIPKWLDWMLPNVDIEGAALERRHPVHALVDGPDYEETIPDDDLLDVEADDEATDDEDEIIVDAEIVRD